MLFYVLLLINSNEFMKKSSKRCPVIMKLKTTDEDVKIEYTPEER